jgi:hypothetical protein
MTTLTLIYILAALFLNSLIGLLFWLSVDFPRGALFRFSNCPLLIFLNAWPVGLYLWLKGRTS